jgi:xylan 1,4-beta-xylosidase
MNYWEPIIAGFHPDPSICRVGDAFYLVNSSFEYFPGVPIFRSHDLLHWQQIGHCLTRTSQLDLRSSPASGGIYAPTLRYHDGMFYLITTHVDQGKHFIVTATDPAGEWSDPIWIEQGGFDPSLCFLDDGTVLLTWTEIRDGGNPTLIRQSQIDVSTGALLDEPQTIWHGMGGTYPEGPHLYSIDGRYYLLIAEGGTSYGHMCNVARSDSPWGPFEPCPHNPILTHRSLSHPIQATGHGDLVQAQDESWWMVFLGIRPAGGYPPYHVMGRETFLTPVSWQDGWPVVGHGGQVLPQMAVPSFAEAEPTAPVTRDDFQQTQLALAWNLIRTPHKQEYDLTARPGWLRLACVGMTLDDAEPSFVGRRQEHHSFQVQTLMDFSTQSDGDEAGLTAFMNDKHHAEIALVQEQGERQLIVRNRIGSLSAVMASHPAPSGPIELHITATPTHYTFSWSLPGGQHEVLAQSEARYLAPEVAGGFTGVYLGLYATGNHQTSDAYADFDWFTYQAEHS